MISRRSSIVCFLLLLLLRLAQSSIHDPYRVLGVPRNANQADIRRAYRTLCLKYHPDKNLNRPAFERKTCEETFKEIQKAYELVGDEASRKQHDFQSRYSGQYTSSNVHTRTTQYTNADDFFSDFFSARKHLELK